MAIAIVSEGNLMKIKLFFVHPKNYGNMMMVDSFISYLKDIMIEKHQINPEFYVDVMDEEELELAKRSLPEDTIIYRENLFNRKRRGAIGKIQKLICIPYEIIYNIRNYDACILLGGDCISQYYSKQVFVSNMIKFHFISKKKKTFAPGQTMGPFSGYAIALVKWALKKVKIYVRDHDCYEYMKYTFGFSDIYESRDLASLDIPYQHDYNIIKDTLRKYVGNRKYVTVVPSGANLQYTTDTNHYIEEYARIIIGILNNSINDILLLAHVIHTNTSNDKPIIEKIVSKIPDEYKKRIHTITTLIMPYEARILLGHGEYTITGRMHAAVSSINMGVIPICLSYSVKYKGVIGDVYGLNNYIVECRGNKMWESNQVSDRVLEIQRHLVNHKKDLLKLIYSKNFEVKKMAMWQIEDIADNIL